MQLSALVAHVALACSLLAIALASLRAASLLAPFGLERAIAWAVLGGAAVLLEELVLGLVGLAGSSVALTAAAVLTWVAARSRLPPVTTAPAAELAAWWSERARSERVALGAVGGVLLAFAATLAHRPEPGFDGITYHLPEIVGFVQSGHAGTVLYPYYGLPVGNYPLTNEVLLAWATGISHGYGALTLYPPLSLLLMLLAGWLGLRELGVAPRVRGLALAALALGPLVLAAATAPGTDLPALTWLVCCAALCAAARRQPLLLVAAEIALGLSVGTKTTPAVMGLIVAITTVWVLRARLRQIARPLALGLVVAIACGGPWYLRNLFDHGSPLWPFVAAPWGDPVPPSIQLFSHTMAERLQATLFDHLRVYVSAVSGSLVLLLGGIVIPPFSRSRRALLAGLVVLIGTVAWANAPVTGLPDVRALYVAVGTAVRYLLPVFAAGALALALAAMGSARSIRMLACGALAAAIVWALVTDARHSFYLPYASWLLPGAILGALLGGVGALPQRRRWTRLSAAAGAGAVAIVIGGVALAEASHSFLARHAQVMSEWDAPAAAYLAAQPGFTSGSAGVASAPVALGTLAGDRLQHRIALVGETEPCPQVLARARRGWVVVRVVTPEPVPGHPGLTLPVQGTAQGCLAGRRALFDDGTYRVYGPGS